MNSSHSTTEASTSQDRNIKSNKTLGIYIHIPFCRCICLYCAFATYANKSKQIPIYIEKLISEIETKSLLYKDYTVDTIYFGGGTPSLIDTIYISRVIKYIKDNFNCTSNIEIALEANPETINVDKCKDYKKIGINRITLGVQTLNDKSLFKIARIHKAEDIFKAINCLKENNINNIGLDFIIGLPYQKQETINSELKNILNLNIPHLSYYFLSYDTPKISLFEKFCPSEDEQVQMYHYICKTLKENGYIHYEVSNFAQKGFESKHNLKYWNQEEYLGFGISAHSYVNETTSYNTSVFDDYINQPTKQLETTVLDHDMLRMDYIMLNLRKNTGIDINHFKAHFGETELTRLKSLAEELISEELLILENNKLYCTEKGFLFIDTITRKLI